MQRACHSGQGIRRFKKNIPLIQRITQGMIFRFDLFTIIHFIMLE